MSEKYTTIQQHEPLRIPSGWTEQERRLIAQLEEIFDDLYRRFNRLRLEDLNPKLSQMITTSSDGLKTLSTTVTQTAERLESVATKTDATAEDVVVLESRVTQTAEKLENLVLENGNFHVYVQPTAPTEQPVVGDVWIKKSPALTWAEAGSLTWNTIEKRTWNDLLGNGEPVSHYWDGTEWVVMADPNITLSNRTKVTQTAKALESVATQTIVNSQGVSKLETGFKQTAEALELKANKGDPATSLETTTVTVTSTGVRIKTGGTFQVDSGNFELDEQGKLSAQDAYLSGDIYTRGFPVLSENDIAFGTQPPSSPHSGMIWIKPDASTSAQVTFSKTITWGDRQNMVANIRTGTLTGSATEAVGSSYSYRIRIPVYIREYSGGKTGAVLHFDLYDSDGGTLLLSASRNVTIDEYGSGNKVIEIAMAGGEWVGNRNSLFFRLYTTQLSGYYAYNVLNSSDNSASITVNCTSVSTSGATGWRECQVYSFA